MSKRILIYEDQPERFAGIDRFKDALFYVDIFSLIYDLQIGGIDELWLDHDLGDLGVPGMKVVDFLCEQASKGRKLDIGTIYVHSMNASVNLTMRRQLERWGYKAVVMPISVVQNVSGVRNAL